MNLYFQYVREGFLEAFVIARFVIATAVLIAIELIDLLGGVVLIIAVMILASMITGCASTAFREPTYQELSAASYGAPIAQDDAQALALRFLSARLKDADSAKYQWGSVERGYLKDAPIIGGRAYAGYVMHVEVNAKNSYGGYAGFQDFAFLFFNGSINRVYHETGIPIQ